VAAGNLELLSFGFVVGNKKAFNFVDEIVIDQALMKIASKYKGARDYNVLVAFDADYKTNPAVARQLARLIAAREKDIAARTTTRIVTWQRYKGIDDAVLANAPLQTLTILEWISTLEGTLLKEVRAAWDLVKYSPLH
jgi:hypothetical protein